LPDLKIRFVNVVELMRLQDKGEHPHGLSMCVGYKEEDTTTTPFDMVMLKEDLGPRVHPGTW
jgi:phosphoketolase